MRLLRKKSEKNQNENHSKNKNMILNDFENRFLIDFLPQGNPKKTKQGNYEIASQEIRKKIKMKIIQKMEYGEKKMQN